MNSTDRVFALLVDGDASSHDQVLVWHHAAVAFTRVVRSRRHQLLVQADCATTTAILMAAAEYYTTGSLESDMLEYADVSVLLPIDMDAKTAESRGFTHAMEDSGPHISYAGTLGQWANAIPRATQLESQRLPFLRESPKKAFAHLRPVLTLILGSTERLGRSIDAADAVGAPTFYDGRSELRVKHRALQSVLSDEQVKFDWRQIRRSVAAKESPPYPNEYTELQRQSAQHEAILHLAMETLVERVDEERTKRTNR